VIFDGVLIVLAGAGVSCVGLVQLVKVRRLRRTGVRSVGTVVSHEETTDDGSLYAPVITFVDEHGSEHRFTSATRTSWRVHRVGRKVPVIYPSGRPDTPRLTSFGHDVLVVGLPLALGALFVFFGLLALIQD
jgi:hypothetical protein